MISNRNSRHGGNGGPEILLDGLSRTAGAGGEGGGGTSGGNGMIIIREYRLD